MSTTSTRESNSWMNDWGMDTCVLCLRGAFRGGPGALAAGSQPRRWKVSVKATPSLVLRTPMVPPILAM
jgi:hypothetical protein